MEISQIRPLIQGAYHGSMRALEISTFVWEKLFHLFGMPARISLRMVLPITFVTTAYIIRGYNVFEHKMIHVIVKVIDYILLLFAMVACFRALLFSSTFLLGKVVTRL